MPCAAPPDLRHTGCHPLAQDLARKLGNDRQHPGQRPSHRGGDFSRVIPGDNAHAQRLRLVESAHQVRSGLAPRSTRPTTMASIAGRQAARMRTSRWCRSLTSDPTASTVRTKSPAFAAHMPP
jgi:hypothetical protein